MNSAQSLRARVDREMRVVMPRAITQLLQDALVQLPGGVSEHCRERQPCQVWQQHHRCKYIPAPERDDRGCDEHPQEQDLPECNGALVPTEEDPCPQRVCAKLKHEQYKWDSCRPEPARPPDEP